MLLGHNIDRAGLRAVSCHSGTACVWTCTGPRPPHSNVVGRRAPLVVRSGRLLGHTRLLSIALGSPRPVRAHLILVFLRDSVFRWREVSTIILESRNGNADEQARLKRTDRRLPVSQQCDSCPCRQLDASPSRTRTSVPPRALGRRTAPWTTITRRQEPAPTSEAFAIPSSGTPLESSGCDEPAIPRP
jgi:hypothetical protein